MTDSKRSQNDSWLEYKRLVLNEQERHQKWLEKLQEENNNMKLELNTLKMKMLIIGCIGGTVASAIGTFVMNKILAP